MGEPRRHDVPGNSGPLSSQPTFGIAALGAWATDGARARTLNEQRAAAEAGMVDKIGGGHVGRGMMDTEPAAMLAQPGRIDYAHVPERATLATCVASVALWLKAKPCAVQQLAFHACVLLHVSGPPSLLAGGNFAGVTWSGRLRLPHTRLESSALRSLPACRNTVGLRIAWRC